MKRLSLFALTILLISITAGQAFSQDPAPQASPQPSAEDIEKQKAERERNALRLLDQVIDEAQSLRLVENRVRIQISAADMLWERNQPRARTLFTQAADGVAELGRTEPNQNNRRGQNIDRSAFQLRQELVLSVARHDAPLAYQLLAATKPPANTQSGPDNRNPRMAFNPEDNLEQVLLGRVAALDPKLAGQNAEQMIDKGQFPRTLPDVINQLQKQDSDAAAKLTDKTLKKIQAANLLTNNDAGNLAVQLLVFGPKMPTASTSSDGMTAAGSASISGRVTGVLDQSAYTDLLSTVVDVALKAQPQPRPVQVPQRRGGGAGSVAIASTASPATDAQLEQAGARRLLSSLQATLSNVDQYLPSKASQLRQKLSEFGMGDSSRQNFSQALMALQQGNANVDTLVQAAASAPPQMQSRIYQQAAYKAIDDGDTDRARQIATSYLQDNARDDVMKRIDARDMVKKAEGAQLDEIKMTLGRLQSDNERIDLLVTVASGLQTTNPKLASQLLDEAKQLTGRRATSYDQFNQQLKVAHAFATVDPARSFEVLEPGITQLNELLAAAAVLSGFEINLFKDGEMSFQGGSGLTGMISRYGQELSFLAKSDFDRAELLTGRFQFAEPRIMTRLAIVQGLLGAQVPQNNFNFQRNIGQTMFSRQD
jgi:hypothetical protein